MSFSTIMFNICMAVFWASIFLALFFFGIACSEALENKEAKGKEEHK